MTFDLSEHWSKKILYGHESPKPGQRFNDVRGLAFHNDKLLVCDSDNNIVHILNQDYTCEKELGSFSGQFAKPFKPWSIAVSQDNLYFILDKSNVQIVVCDKNNKVIRIINLPADSNPWCIALVKGFVIVTEVNSHRVLKYSLDGMYIGEFGRQGDGHTEFNFPYFVAVNSRDVIMVSDCYNHCIKCFDTQFNYLYKYGHRGTGNAQLSYPHSIAVDGADNVYVCDQGNDRISIWSEDTTWLRHLFHRELSLPWYMAVTADGDRIAVVSGLYQSCNEIVVFSK
ncbi:tripartite motif-containing protein 2-like [Ptychodera flava]|uniref:tripartite motif-containing protein 2-like n=1 Tax=Ptychodera flava TaxID=63121 RepID=UPI00396A39C7